MAESEKKYTVWVFEDSNIVRRRVEHSAEKENFEILLWLTTFPQALAAIQEFDESTQKKPDVVLVDGDLRFSQIAGDDGKQLVKSAKEKGLLTVAYTDTPIGADINPGEKVDWFDLRELLSRHDSNTTASQT